MEMGYCSNTVFERDVRFQRTAGFSNVLSLEKGRGRTTYVPMGDKAVYVKLFDAQPYRPVNKLSQMPDELPQSTYSRDIFLPQLLVAPCDIIGYVDCVKIGDSRYYVYADSVVSAMIHSKDNFTTVMISPAALARPTEFTLKNPDHNLLKYLNDNPLEGLPL